MVIILYVYSGLWASMKYKPLVDKHCVVNGRWTYMPKCVSVLYLFRNVLYGKHFWKLVRSCAVT